jgi:hypothetical protein
MEMGVAVVPSLAQRLVVSPASPSGWFNVVKGCDGKLCWAVWLIDRKLGKAEKIQIGKYDGLGDRTFRVSFLNSKVPLSGDLAKLFAQP